MGNLCRSLEGWKKVPEWRARPFGPRTAHHGGLDFAIAGRTSKHESHTGFLHNALGREDWNPRLAWRCLVVGFPACDLNDWEEDLPKSLLNLCQGKAAVR